MFCQKGFDPHFSIRSRLGVVADCVAMFGPVRTHFVEAMMRPWVDDALETVRSQARLFELQTYGGHAPRILFTDQDQ